MKKVHQLFWFLLTLLLSGCQAKSPLSGILELDRQDAWKPIVYLIDPGDWQGIASSYVGTVLDSAIIDDDGHFSFRQLPSAPTPQLFQLAIQKKGEQYPNQLDNENPLHANYFPIIWQSGDRIHLTAQQRQFQQSLRIQTPSPANAALLQLRDIYITAYQTFTSESATPSHDESGLLDEEKAVLEFQQPLMQFADTTNQFLPALVAIRWVSIESDYERVPEFVVRQCERWQGEHPQHPWSNQLCIVGDKETLPILMGAQMPDFSLPMAGGDTVALQTLMGSKLTMLDLWASWCAPCRKQNREFLVPLWEKYHNQGFQIVGYALDASRKTWQKAIKADGADRWLHASDLQGDEAPLFQTLRLSTIPANFLLDADGKVVAKNLHGEELAHFVHRYFEE
jgi:peroxiredoxin